MATLLSQGAEAKIFLYLTGPSSSQKMEGKPNKLPLGPFAGDFPAIMKHRFTKTWRNPALDFRLRKARHKQEVGCMVKAFEGNLPVPRILGQDPDEMVIWTEYIEGETLKSSLTSGFLNASDGHFPSFY